MSSEQIIDLSLFNNKDAVYNLDSGSLAKLAGLAVNAEQLDLIAKSINMSAEVVTAIMNNARVKLQDLCYDTFMQLATLSNSSEELCMVISGVTKRIVMLG